MRTSKTLAKIRAGKPVKMCCLGHFVPAYIHHASHFGYDCIWTDNEHRTMSEREVQSLLTNFHLADIDCMLRPKTTEKTELYRYLEDGATGLMIPHVSTPEAAYDLVQSTKFPPIGNRGIDNAGIDSDFHLHDADTYVDHINSETFLVIQIETPEGVANAEEIASIEGLDGIFVGPGDLGLLIRRTDTDLTLEEGIATVASACAKHNIAWGMPAPDADAVVRLRDQGAQLIAYGGDFGFMMQGLSRCGDELAAAFGE